MACGKLHAILRSQGSRHTRILGNALKIQYVGNLKLAQEKGLQFYQTRSHAVALYNTLPAACIEKAVCMKTQDELHQKMRFTPRVPRVVLKSNSQHAWSCKIHITKMQDHLGNHQVTRTVTGKLVTRIVDHRISGVPLSAAEPQKTTRENNVKRLEVREPQT